MAQELLRWWSSLLVCTLLLILVFGALYLLARQRRGVRGEGEDESDE